MERASASSSADWLGRLRFRPTAVTPLERSMWSLLVLSGHRHGVAASGVQESRSGRLGDGRRDLPSLLHGHLLGDGCVS
jgi:hypothetical protein